MTPVTTDGDNVVDLVDGAELLDQVEAAICSYVVLPDDHTAAAVVLWIAATHAVPAWNTAPRLVIKAPEKRCGKSRLLDLIEALCHRPILTANASPSAVYRSIGEHPSDPPTLRRSGHHLRPEDRRRERRPPRAAQRWSPARPPRSPLDAGSRRLDRIATFAMAALAGIGNMPDTIEDRAVIVGMRRRAPDEVVQPYRTRRDGPALASLKGDLHRWVGSHLDQLEAAAPELPVEDRAADTWEPLVAIADAAGGDWPTNARAAVLGLTTDDVDVENVSLRVRLLIDCRTAFGDAERLPSETLVARLRADAEAPWDTLGRNGLTPKSLAGMLHDFGIQSARDRWEDGSQARGFRREQFEDSWRRYCPVRAPSHSPVTPVTASHEREAVTGEPPCDTSPVTERPIRHKSTVMGRRDTCDGKAQPTSAAVCISCRQPLSYDDGTHTHPTCTT